MVSASLGGPWEDGQQVGIELTPFAHLTSMWPGPFWGMISTDKSPPKACIITASKTHTETAG